MGASNQANYAGMKTAVTVLFTGALMGIGDYIIARFRHEPYDRVTQLATGIILLTLIPVLLRTRAYEVVFTIGAIAGSICFLYSFILCGNVYFLACGIFIPIVAAICAGSRTGLTTSIFYALAALACAIAISFGWIRTYYGPEELVRGTCWQTTCIVLLTVGLCGATIWREWVIEAVAAKKHRTDLSLQKQLTGLRLLADATSQMLTLDPAVDGWNEMLSRFAEHLDCELFTNYEIVGSKLELRASTGLSGDWLEEMSALELGDKVCGYCAQIQNTVYLVGQELAKDPRGGELWKLGFRSIVATPLMYGSRLVGTISFASKSRNSFAIEELNFVTLIAQSIASVRGKAIAEAQKHSSETQFRALVDCAADDFFLMDGELRIIDVNRQACLSLGYDRDELLRMRMSQVVSKPSYRQMRELEHKLRKQAVAVETGIHRRKDGSEFPVETHLSRVVLNGKVFVIALAHNISERKQYEERLNHLQKMEAIGRLAGGVAHDFNNLLCIINSYSELLLHRTDLSVDDREALEAIHEAGERGASLTSQLLVFGRKAVFAPKAVDLNEVVVDASRILTRLAGENIVFQQVLSPMPCGVLADRTQLDQILINLVVNGRDAMPQGGTMILETKVVPAAELGEGLFDREANYVQLIVKDSGCGISTEIQSQIFDPFFTTKEVGKGTGLGLAVVYGIVKQFGGWIEVKSQPNVGTTFTLTFPSHELTASPAKPEVETSLLNSVATILLVEDESGVRQVTAMGLRQQGYKVIEAESCMDAIELAKNHPGQIDAMLTDVIMPVLSGPQLAVEIHKYLPSLPVLFMSGYSYDRISKVSDPAVAENLLQKPFSQQELAVRMRETLMGRSAATMLQH